MASIKQALAGVALAGVLVTGTAMVAGAQPTSPGPGTQQVERGLRAERAAARRLRQVVRGVHGEAIVKDKTGQWVTITWDRGTVTSTAGGITLERKDGVSVTITVDAGTTFHGVTGLAELRTGDPAVVISKAGVATQVAQRKA